MHYYSQNIGDYRRDTTHLTLLEHGAYRQLIDTYYLMEKPLTLDHADLMRTHCARSADEVRAIENVLKDFFVRTDEGYMHKRCDIEIEAFHAKSTSARESAKARWARVREEKDANALRTHCEGNANHKPITNNQEPITKKIKSVCSPQADEPEKTKAKRATKIPDPFLLTAEMREWAAAKAQDVNTREETENFVDYWRGAGKPKVDWVATWRTWMRRAQGDTAKRKAFAQPVNRQQQIEDVNAAVVREIAERELSRASGAPAPQQEDFLSTGEIIIEGEFTHAP